jgi:hypothetical protein
MGNHVLELLLPFFLFLPRPLRVFGGAMQVAFQVRANIGTYPHTQGRCAT